MLRTTNPKPAELENYIAERNAVKKFVEESPEIKKMYELFLQEPGKIITTTGAVQNNTKIKERELLNKLTNAETFHELDEATKDMNYERYIKEHPTDKVAQILGSTGIKLFFGAASWFSDEVNFSCQARRFREKLVAHMKENNYFMRDQAINKPK